ncbi:MAG: CopG family transcriptional regulator [Elusimicrobiota bacterium]
MKSVFTVRLSSDTRKELEQISRQEREPLGQIVRESIEHYIAVKRFRQLRKKTLPFAEAQGLITDEDVFRALKK